MATEGYHLEVITWSGGGDEPFHQETTYQSHGILGDVPRIGEILTVHPDGKPSEKSFTCNVTGVQRVIHHYPDNPEVWPKQSSVHVTGKIQGG